MSSGNWLVYALVTLMLWGLWGFFYKLAGESIPYRGVLFYGILGAMAANVVILAFLGVPETGVVDAKYAVLGGFLGAAGLITFVLAIEGGRISVVTPLTALYPVITILLAVLVLHESVGVQKAVGILFAVVAMVLIGL